MTYFEEYGLDARILEKSGEYELVQPCAADDTKTTVARVIVEDYKTITWDETHEALDGYEWKTRNHNDSKNLLTTTLSNGTKTATFYVNADVDGMSGSVTVTASGSECYLVGYGVGTAEAPYQAVSGSVTLAPGQAVICIA
jgi:hypothetical protein